MKKVLLFISLVVFSCSFQRVPRKVEAKYKCYDGISPGLEKIINIDGYYVWKEPNRELDHNTTGIMFFKDGMYLNGIYDINFTSRPGKKQNIRRFLQEIVSRDSTYYKLFYNQVGWGNYIIAGDTIKTQCISMGDAYGYTTEVKEIWYKVLDKETIQEIYYYDHGGTAKENKVYNLEKYTPHVKNGNNGQSKLVTPEPLIYKFIPSDAIPESDCWLKKENWFWCK